MLNTLLIISSYMPYDDGTISYIRREKGKLFEEITFNEQKL